MHPYLNCFQKANKGWAATIEGSGETVVYLKTGVGDFLGFIICQCQVK